MKLESSIILPGGFFTCSIKIPNMKVSINILSMVGVRNAGRARLYGD